MRGKLANGETLRFNGTEISYFILPSYTQNYCPFQNLELNGDSNTLVAYILC